MLKKKRIFLLTIVLSIVCALITTLMFRVGRISVISHISLEPNVSDLFGWKFSVLPRTYDGTDGIFQARVTNKTLWNVLDYERNPLASSEITCGSNLLVIMVHSATGHKGRRNLLRQTYSIYSKAGIFHKLGHVKILFVIGNDRSEIVIAELRMEERNHRDLIRGNFLDHYHNMTIKNLLGKVKIHQMCDYDYLLKIDDDVFINIPVILLNLHKLQPKYPGTYMGWPCQAETMSSPINSQKRTFSERTRAFNFTLQDYPFPRTPHYGYGFGYLLDRKAVHILTEEYKYTPYVRVVDDLYVAFVLTRSHIKCCKTESFYITREAYKDGCELNDVLIWNDVVPKGGNPEVVLPKIYEDSLKAFRECDNTFSQLECL